MESLFLSLAKILKRQNKTVNELLETARHHNLALRQNDMTSVLATANKQAELSFKLSEQDKRREGIQRKLAEKYGLEGNPSLKGLLPHAAGTAAIELGDLSRSLKDSLKQVSDIKDSNYMMAKSAQMITEQMIRSFRPKSGSTYLGSGRMSDKPTSIVDKTI